MSKSTSRFKRRDSKKSVPQNDDQHNENTQQTISKFFMPVASCKRTYCGGQDNEVTANKKACPPSASSSASSSDTGVSGVSVSKTTCLKLQSFSSERADWESFDGGCGNQHLVRISNSHRQFVKESERLPSEGTSPLRDHGRRNETVPCNPEPSTSLGVSVGKDDLAEKLSSFHKTAPVRHSKETDIGAAKSAVVLGRKVKYTPLEQQVVELKKDNPGVILFIECGYKYRFFGQDAEIAAKELNIFCHLDHNYMTASIPTHRLHVHLGRLVAKGYKVGVVKQTETAALKAAGDNKSAPFCRKLTAVYTRATLIGTDVEPSGEDVSEASPAGGHLMCIWETTPENKPIKKNCCELAFVSVQVSTGDIVYDVFEDNNSRLELASRLEHIQPVEILLPEGVSELTEKIIKHHAAILAKADDALRIEIVKREWYDETRAANNLRQLYASTGAESGSLATAPQLPGTVHAALNALIQYLTDFNLHRLLRINSLFEKFNEESQSMVLSGKTLGNLEVLVNSLDGKPDGSLFWLLNHTSTQFGARLLKKWLTKPLNKKSAINERLDAVQCIVEGKCPDFVQLKGLLNKMPDLEKTLAVIFHGKCSPWQFLVFCQSLYKIYVEIDKNKGSLLKQLSSSLLRNTITELLELLDEIEPWIDALDAEQARTGNDKSSLFKNEENFQKLHEHKLAIKRILDEIQDHRRDLRLLLRMPALEYVTVSGIEFLIEVKNTNLQAVPQDWVKISSTKTVSRFHSPLIVDAVKRLSQLREQLIIDSNDAWQLFLRSFEDEYAHYRKAVGHLAVLDCLFSLAYVAKQQDYCRPVIADDGSCVQIEQGRHPIIDVLKSGQEQFVPNDTHLESCGERCMIITGPNMGGKSSYIKQVALITLMAQSGSFVPASSARVGIVDAIFTRMGASDELYEGRSTFMVELQEASEVIGKATDRSLVILDELGRGTSTHDGVALAYATLKYFVQEVKCLTMFVTHYPPITEIESLFPGLVKNYHMSFYVQEEDSMDDGIESLAFLYQLVPGVAQCSYGLNVARLADVPVPILQLAKAKSQHMQQLVIQRGKKRNEFIKLMGSSKLADFAAVHSPRCEDDH